MASQVDWEAIESEFRAGQLSVRQIAKLYGVTHTAINKKAKELGWVRDLTEKVREATRAKLVSTEVSSEVSTANARVKEAETVDRFSDRAVSLIRSHQRRLDRASRIADKLLEELEASTDDHVENEEAIEEETASDRSPHRRNAMLKAVSLPGRSSTVRELSMTLKNLIPLERQAFNIETQSPDEEPATNADVRSAVSNLTIDQLKQLRSIHSSAFGSAEPHEGD